MRKDRIVIIIPAYRAHSTIMRCLSSIAIQTIIEDVSVVLVNDCCPEGDYAEAVKAFGPCMDIREIRAPVNGGPGTARQIGIDNSDSEFIAFVDADDFLFKATSLETLRREISTDDTYMCASGAFYSPKYRDDPTKNSQLMVWLFGKLYRRAFLDKYKIRFNGTRANEDSGFNRTVLMLCDNPQERIKLIEEVLYYYSARDKSITNINGNIYYFDQGICGGIDNMIWAIEHARRAKPFSGEVIRTTVNVMCFCYFGYMSTIENDPDLSIQLWEYIKKYYHTCYERIEDYVTDGAFKQAYFGNMISAARNRGFIAVTPYMTVQEFMHRLKTEEYDPDLIREIREEMKTDPRYQDIMMNNVACGVCPECYSDIPFEEVENEIQISES